ncbi:MAG: Unknown protein [uncultured Sulfurovum sp.]|uniref:Uncharacterized protein n=1 Tax=uncultured Sulfurovum sp. TaxID=269237 RepID=A0A6S6SE38_9BACT|nr:MAG: Unknown protein [uncultured Sulfurovum sp.]
MKKIVIKKVFKPKTGTVSMACTLQGGYAR